MMKSLVLHFMITRHSCYYFPEGISFIIGGDLNSLSAFWFFAGVQSSAVVSSLPQHNVKDNPLASYALEMTLPPHRHALVYSITEHGGLVTALVSGPPKPGIWKRRLLPVATC